MAPDPDGERIARLEAAERVISRDIERLERKLDEALEKLGAIDLSMNRRRGTERVAVWILDAVRMIAAGIAGAGLSDWISWRH